MSPRDRAAAFLSAECDGSTPVIDLHCTESIPEALERMERGLYQQAGNHSRYCKIVHGIGNGGLSTAIHHVLDFHPLIQAYQEQENGGACYVLL